MPQYRELGRSGLQVGPIAFGGNVFGWSVDEKTAFALLDAFVEAGFNLVDTADVYPAWVPGNRGGESETIIGRWLQRSGKRDKVVIATKVAKWAEHPGLSADNINAAVEDSLRRLQTDVIDLYQAHEDDDAVPLEETLGAFARLIQAGKVRAIGASNLTPERLTEALDVARTNNLPRYESLQPLYNLYDRADFENGLEKICRENELGVISYYSLAAGFLTGKYRSADDLGQSARGKSVEKYLTDRGSRIIAALDDVARNLDVTPAQVAIAWLIAQPSITAPIASATRSAQLGDLIAAAELKLSDDEIALLNKASS